MTTRLTRTLALLAALSACGGEPQWAYQTPAINLPEAFEPAPQSGQKGRATFPERRAEVVMGWELQRSDEVSQILMRRHPGSTRPEDVWAAVNRIRTHNQSWTVEGPTTRQVAGRPAWEWTASIPSVEGGQWASQRTLIVAYPDSTWVTSFWGQHLEWHDQAKLDAVLSSFRIVVPPRPLPLFPLIAVATLALVGLILWLRARPKQEPARPMPSREPVHTPRANLLQQQSPGAVDPAVMAGSGAPPEV